MTKRSVTHGTFRIERVYPATPARVFAAWARADQKPAWFGSPDEGPDRQYELDFRVGGREFASGRTPGGGATYTYEALFQDILPDERIVYSYIMDVNDTRISVSLGSVEFRPEGTGTRLTYVEHGAYLDGHDSPASRERGTIELFDNLEIFLTGA